MKSNLNRRTTFVSSMILFAALFFPLLLAPKASAGYPTAIDDNADLYQRGQGGLGLPAWRVSEPFTSLWIQYPVIRYITSAGKTVNFDIAFRQRGSAISATNVFGF